MRLEVRAECMCVCRVSFGCVLDPFWLRLGCVESAFEVRCGVSFKCVLGSVWDWPGQAPVRAARPRPNGSPNGSPNGFQNAPFLGKCVFGARPRPRQTHPKRTENAISQKKHLNRICRKYSISRVSRRQIFTRLRHVAQAGMNVQTRRGHRVASIAQHV